MDRKALTADEAERFRTFERRRHDALAGSYHDFFTPVTMHAIAPLLAAAGVTAGASLLEVACGTAAVAAAAQAQGARASATDLSPKMVALGQQQHPQIDIRAADVEHQPFADQAFDCVVCSFGIGHFPYPERAAAECARVLKHGGRLAVAWWDVPETMRLQGLFREAIAEVGARPPPDVPAGNAMLRFTDPAELGKLLESAGLGDLRIEEHSAAHSVPDVETLWRGGLGSFAITGSAVAHQDAATQTRIRQALERRAQPYRTADGLLIPFAFRVASGRKT
ncbi:MAG TPA: class I SAM-dependent methyltransferase [Pseudolabrys sp.]|nr:class I SAM-dependent methyltransferase [Pseudolabrys sp.]